MLSDIVTLINISLVISDVDYGSAFFRGMFIQVFQYSPIELLAWGRFFLVSWGRGVMTSLYILELDLYQKYSDADPV
jgi:hypothetical protein